MMRRQCLWGFEEVGIETAAWFPQKEALCLNHVQTQLSEIFKAKAGDPRLWPEGGWRDRVHIDLTHYAGAVGQVIKVHATDSFEVICVKVKLTRSDGSFLEEGLPLPTHRLSVEQHDGSGRHSRAD